MSGLLVLGAGRHQTPLIARAESRGIRSIALDYYDDSPGKKIASAAVLADALDIEAVLAAARDHEIDAVTTVGTDQAVIVVATVAHELGLPCHISIEGALAATNKVNMRAALQRAGVPMTTGVVLERNSAPHELVGLSLPCVVKAADSQGQRGMRLIDDAADLPEAIETAMRFSRTSTVVVEQFSAGLELTINAWMRSGEPVVMIPADRHTFNPPPAIGICLRHVAPSVHRDQREALADITNRVATGYNISDGPLYIQLLSTAEGFRVVEAASRVGGGHEAQLFEEMYGLSMLDLTIDLAFGRNDRSIPDIRGDRSGVVNFVVARPGTIERLSSIEPLIDDGLIDQGQWYVAPGHEQSIIVDSLGRIGALVVTGPSHTDVLSRAAAAYGRLVAADREGANLVFWPEPAELNVAD